MTNQEFIDYVIKNHSHDNRVTIKTDHIFIQTIRLDIWVTPKKLLININSDNYKQETFYNGIEMVDLLIKNLLTENEFVRIFTSHN